MTAYIINKERCEIRGLKDIKSKETMLQKILEGDREPIEIARYTDLEEAKAAFKKLTKDFKNSDIKTVKYGGVYCTDFDLYTLEEWEWDTDEDSDIIVGGDIWDWSIE